MTRSPHWLKVFEYTALGASVVGTIAAVVSQQVIYAAAPIVLTIGLNAVNRQRFNQLNQSQNQSLFGQAYQPDTPDEQQFKNQLVFSKAYKPNETHQLISSSTSVAAIEDFIEKLNKTIEIATVNSNIASKDLQKLLTFISQVIEVGNKCLLKMLGLLHIFKYMTMKNLKDPYFRDSYLEEFSGFSFSPELYDAERLCDRLHLVRESYDIHIVPIFIRQNLNGLDEWLATFFELEGVRCQTIKLVRMAYDEIREPLEKKSVVFNDYSYYDASEDDLNTINENQLKPVVEEINNKASQYFDVFDTSLRKLLRLHNKILGNSGEVGFLELINDRSSLMEQAKIFFTHIGDKSVSETFNNNLQGANIANFANQVQDNARQQANQYNFTPEQKQTLSEAAAEIQRLLKKLEETNPTATEAEKQAYVTNSLPPKFRERAVSALKAGGKEALKEMLDNPYVNIGVAIVEGWQNPE